MLRLFDHLELFLLLLRCRSVKQLSLFTMILKNVLEFGLLKHNGLNVDTCAFCFQMLPFTDVEPKLRLS